jgi:hypothetical protein
MATKDFVDNVTVIDSDWLNDTDAHVYDQESGAHTAENIINVPSGSVVAIDVQGAINELDLEKQALITPDTADFVKDTLRLQVNGHTALRAIAPVNGERVYRTYHTAEGDGGALVFRGVTGAAPGTYTENGGTIAVPVGGDGSAAWVDDDDSGPINARTFGLHPSKTGAENAAALQAAVDYAALSISAIKSVFVPAGAYTIDVVYLPRGVELYGESFSLELTWSGTRFVQSSAAGDVFRLKPVESGGIYRWYGHLHDFSIMGDNTQATGFGINTKDIDDHDVNIQDSTLIYNIGYRRMPEGGINITTGAFPIRIGYAAFLWNNGPGITVTRGTTMQSLHFDNISGDGNNGGLIEFNTLNDASGHVTITNLKSEARVNSEYGGAEHQNNAIVFNNCGDLPVIIEGMTHSSSIPDGAFYKKPGAPIAVTGSPPSIKWNAVAVRVRGTDTGTDPGIFTGVTGASPPEYTRAFGSLNLVDYMFRATSRRHRSNNADGDTTPSVAGMDTIIITNSAPTTITQFDDSYDGQLLICTFADANTTINDGGNFALSASFTSTANDVMLLINIAGVWREVSRSVN